MDKIILVPQKIAMPYSILPCDDNSLVLEKALPQTFLTVQYGGCSFQELCGSDIVRERHLIQKPEWCFGEQWSNEKFPAGDYRLRIPVLDSGNQTVAEQNLLLFPGERIAPVVLVATAVLAYHLQTGGNLLENNWMRCREIGRRGYIALYWHDGQLNIVVHGSGDIRQTNVLMASVFAPL